MDKKKILKAAIAGAAGSLLFAGVAFAQTAPSLTVGIDVSPHITPNTRSTVALVKLDASNSNANVQVPALSFSGSFAGGAGQTTLKNCSIALTNAINLPLNSGANAVANFGSTSVFTFDTPLIVPAGVVRWLGLVCDVDGAAPVAGTVTVGINPALIGATNASSTATIVPTASVGSNGQQQTSGTAGFGNTSTTGSTSGSGTVTTPGIPNTGAGGEFDSNTMLLAVSGLALATGVVLLMQRRRQA